MACPGPPACWRCRHHCRRAGPTQAGRNLSLLREAVLQPVSAFSKNRIRLPAARTHAQLLCITMSSSSGLSKSGGDASWGSDQHFC